jgi:hypothetical protein
MDIDSRWAALACMVRSVSPLILAVSIPSFSSSTLTPIRLSSRMISRHSVKLHAKRLTDLQRILSIFPARQSRSIRWKSGRLAASSPLSPSSA